jgi:hypothetical protein
MKSLEHMRGQNKDDNALAHQELADAMALVERAERK